MKRPGIGLSTTLLLLLYFLMTASVAATDWAPASGYVFHDGLPVCALVLINGESQFSCDGTGRYDMRVPLDESGLVTVQAFASGFSPLREVVTPEQAFEYSIHMSRSLRVGQPAVSWSRATSGTPGWWRLSGSVETRTAPLCSLVLANGQKQFSCDDSLGAFDLDVPLDQDGNITLQVFVAGFQPFRETFLADPDTDNDSINDSEDPDDDNDGILDVDDDCPLVASPGACDGGMEITDTVFADGREWAQVRLFTNLSWSDVNAACANYTCTGVLKGYDVSGWHWATIDDVQQLFNHYLGGPVLDAGDRFGSFHENQGAIALFGSPDAGRDGWQWTSIELPTEGTPASSFRLHGIVKSREFFDEWWGDTFLGRVWQGPLAPEYQYWAPETCEFDCWSEYFRLAAVGSISYRDEDIGVWLYRRAAPGGSP